MLDYMFVAAESICYGVPHIYQEVQDVRIGEILSHITEVGTHMWSLFLPPGFKGIDITNKSYLTKYQNSLNRSKSTRLLI